MYLSFAVPKYFRKAEQLIYPIAMEWRDKKREERLLYEMARKNNRNEKVLCSFHIQDTNAQTKVAKSIETAPAAATEESSDSIVSVQFQGKKRKLGMESFRLPFNFMDYLKLCERMLNSPNQSDQFSMLFRDRCLPDFQFSIDSYLNQMELGALTGHRLISNRQYHGWNNCSKHIENFCKYIPDVIVKLVGCSQLKEVGEHVIVVSQFELLGTFIDFDNIFDDLINHNSVTSLQLLESDLFYTSTADSSPTTSIDQSQEFGDFLLTDHAPISLDNFDDLFSEQTELELFGGYTANSLFILNDVLDPIEPVEDTHVHTPGA